MSRKRGVLHKPAAPTLEVEGLSVAYAVGAAGVGIRYGRPIDGDRLALEDVSFRVSPGERIAIVGPNGAGKSTLFRLIIGTLRPATGSVSIYGHGPAGHTCIAYVPQRNQIDWSFPVTVKDVVMMGRVAQIGPFRWPTRRDWDAVNACLARVDAMPLAGKQIGELSGGQQQRVFIARALAQEAELLLMDEPLAGLDAPSRDAIFEILESLRSEDVTILVATHDLNLAAEHFDRIMLLNRRIVALGPPRSVLSPRNLLIAYGGRQAAVDVANHASGTQRDSAEVGER